MFGIGLVGFLVFGLMHVDSTNCVRVFGLCLVILTVVSKRLERHFIVE
jgi:hypothetical protein